MWLSKLQVTITCIITLLFSWSHQHMAEANSAMLASKTYIHKNAYTVIWDEYNDEKLGCLLSSIVHDFRILNNAWIKKCATLCMRLFLSDSLPWTAFLISFSFLCLSLMSWAQFCSSRDFVGKLCHKGVSF